MLIQVVHDTDAGTSAAVAYPGFVDELFTVSGSPTAAFDLARDIDDDHRIDVFLGGLLRREGVSWARNSTLNRITTTDAQIVGVEVTVRIYLK